MIHECEIFSYRNCFSLINSVRLFFCYDQGSASLEIWPVPSTHGDPKTFSGWYPVPNF